MSESKEGGPLDIPGDYRNDPMSAELGWFGWTLVVFMVCAIGFVISIATKSEQNKHFYRYRIHDMNTWYDCDTYEITGDGVTFTDEQGRSVTVHGNYSVRDNIK